MDPSQIIANLHSLNLGEMAAIRTKIDQARAACSRLDRSDLVEKLDEAGEALERADLKTYRRRLETVIARLGHLK